MRKTRGTLALWMGILSVMMLGVAIFDSPYRPVVGPCRSIEEVWSIEDEHRRSEKPLVTALEMDGMPLVYEAETNTFYCSLGLEQGESWPEIHLIAPETKAIDLFFTDEYTYDDCREAIQKGRAYQVMAYNEEEYDYFSIIFTGLPLLSLTTQTEITSFDTNAQVTISEFGQETVRSAATARYRGGQSRYSDKPGYKIEYRRRDGRNKKTVWETPGLGLVSEMVLLPIQDDLLRGRLSWAVYADMVPETEPFGARRTAYAEVFVNGEYKGVCLMMNPYDEAEELDKAGKQHPASDSVYRTNVPQFAESGITAEDPIVPDTLYELYYTRMVKTPFAPLQGYLDLIVEEDDAVFREKALKRLDINSLLRMELMIQAAGLTDNVFNNLYIWAEWKPNGYVYHFVPWDMDQSWGLKWEDIGPGYDNWLYFYMADRLLRTDASARTALADMWDSCKETVFNPERIAARIECYTRQLEESGAAARNAERWGTQGTQTDGSRIAEYMAVRFEVMETAIQQLRKEDGGKSRFLWYDITQGKGSPIN